MAERPDPAVTALRRAEQAREGEKAWMEYGQERIATLEKTEKLRALRLAKEEQDRQLAAVKLQEMTQDAGKIARALQAVKKTSKKAGAAETKTQAKANSKVATKAAADLPESRPRRTTPSRKAATRKAAARKR